MREFAQLLASAHYGQAAPQDSRPLADTLGRITGRFTAQALRRVAQILAALAKAMSPSEA